MSQIKGKLQVKENKGKKSVMLILPTKKGGESLHPIPEKAKFFQDKDATDGLEVDVEKDEKNNIIKVSIPGKESGLQQPEMRTKQNKNYKNYSDNNNRKSGNINKSPQENPSFIGFPFHNPYTFIPFTKNGKRNKPTLQTADETEQDRFTGIIELKITTQSPLLTYQPEKDKQEGHAEYKALTIGNDVIVPATSVRGALRYLLTVVTGGPLTVVDEEMVLCQGRNLSMDIDPANSRNPKEPCCLARVISPGNSKHGGTIQLGETVIVPAVDIKNKYHGNFDDKRPKDKQKVHYLWADYNSNKIVSVSEKQDATHKWQVKLCGKPVNTKGVKREGIFLANEKRIELPVKFWRTYANCNRHGARPELKKDDLIWLQLKSSDISVPRTENDIVSIQWARWGREGTPLTELLSGTEVLPDYQKNDGQVAIVTDMFGIVPVNNKNSNVPAFAGRIRPDNLVFLDGKKHLTPMCSLAVLASAHPGCLPFYRNGNAQTLNQGSPLAGYKVYRTSKHAGINDKDAPWKFENQGVYGDKGEVKDGTKEKVNFSAELLKPDIEGTVQLSVRSLSMEELSLLILVCNQNTWRLGGGKPLGLGQCNVEVKKILDESGNEFAKDDPKLSVLDSNTLKRFNTWKKTQEPVELLRYPRTAVPNKNKITRGGLTWFSNLGSPKKSGESSYQGMQTVSFVNQDQDGDWDIQGQVLPAFKDDATDFLYGYDVFLEFDHKDHNKNVYHFPPEQFDPEKHVQGNEQSGGFHGQNRQTRKEAKENR
ncbi:MAG: hypothetical protein LBE12_10580 [Planctomycetaceae bacterium]|jgi:CRISPR-associated protein (TIGR03986 family)|nr:hypothetical protein [Planctomycetaceae bacterium]